jgi:hypothetical protein
MVSRRVLITATTATLLMISALLIVHPLIDAGEQNTEKVKEIDTFPRNLVLRGTQSENYQTNLYTRYLLIDKNTIYPNPAQKDSWDADRFDSGYNHKDLNQFVRTMYNKSFVYAKIPQKEYYIIGLPSVSLTFNVTCSDAYAKFELFFTVSLWRISPGGTWDQVINFGTAHEYYYAGPWSYEVDEYFGLWFAKSTPHPVWIGPHEKIALRIFVSGYSEGGASDVYLIHSFNMSKPNQFVVDLPIVEP